MDGAQRWFITLSPLPPGKGIEWVRHGDTQEYLQAGGRADKMQLDIRKPGGAQWGAVGVRYVIGHPHDGNLPVDVPIELPHAPEFVSAAEVFEAEEAGDIFFTYYKTGYIPPGYVVRPVEAWTADGTNIDLRSTKQP